MPSCAPAAGLLASYGLSEGIHFCKSGDQFIVLDEIRDRYFRLSPDLGSLLADEAALQSDYMTGLSRLLNMGLVAKGTQREILQVSTIVPAASVLDSADVGFLSTQSIVPQAAAALLSTYLSLKVRGFHRCLDHVAERKRQGASSARSSPDELYRLAASFEQARRLLPSKTRCLPDSLALMRFLAGRRFTDVQLVIGVRTRPFAAHCWVQTENILLNEVADYAAAFTPIRVV